jgi:hypothetical protein
MNNTTRKCDRVEHVSILWINNGSFTVEYHNGRVDIITGYVHAVESNPDDGTFIVDYHN